jgi:hypothetical protein
LGEGLKVEDVQRYEAGEKGRRPHVLPFTKLKVVSARAAHDELAGGEIGILPA